MLVASESIALCDWADFNVFRQVAEEAGGSRDDDPDASQAAVFSVRVPPLFDGILWDA